MSKAGKGRIHIVIGDRQVKLGVPTKHHTWIGRYVVDRFAGEDIVLVDLGDGWDMESLSSYDRGKRAMENRRYSIDIQVGNLAFDELNEPIHAYNARRRNKWRFRKVYVPGNHCWGRIERFVEDNPQMEGQLSVADLNIKEHGWETPGYLEPLDIDGILYAHYFYNPHTGKPYGGDNLLPRLKTIGRSFTMGHQQGLNYCHRSVPGGRQHGLVLGSTYLHDEKYLGPQGNGYWRGIVVCHQVENGMYDPMFVSLDYLCRRYEGKTLAAFMRKAAA
jgi:hypothetical protein